MTEPLSHWIPQSAPKPEPKPPKVRKRLGAKAGGSAFPHKRHPKYRAFVRSLACTLDGLLTRRQFSTHDVPSNVANNLWQHRCWGPIDPAHIGDHQATGAADVGCVLPMCRAAHDFYDQHRFTFYDATGFSPSKLKRLAEGLTVKFTERGGEL